jgi:hypothetical protein
VEIRNLVGLRASRPELPGLGVQPRSRAGQVRRIHHAAEIDAATQRADPRDRLLDDGLGLRSNSFGAIGRCCSAAAGLIFPKHLERVSAHRSGSRMARLTAGKK